MALMALAAAAYPPGATAVVDWVAAHDRIDVPYVRDCRGILRRPAECPPGYRLSSVKSPPAAGAADD